MKLISLFLIQVIVSFQVIGQSSVFSTLDTRRIYVGLKNTVNIAVPGVKCDSIDLKSSDCQISGEGCTYDVLPNKVGLLKFYIIQKNSELIIDSVEILSGTLPDPEIIIARGHGGTNRLLHKGPEIYMPTYITSKFYKELRIIDFDLKIKRGTKIIYSGKNPSPLYTIQSLNQIKKCIQNDIIIVENVRITGINDSYIKIRGVAAYTVLF